MVWQLGNLTGQTWCNSDMTSQNVCQVKDVLELMIFWRAILK